ncbi:MAG: hypothetical protein KAI24_10785 [Planctomycetes bacterium]|nr:hypothetical protein [Planctomycetota bacterium]
MNWEAVSAISALVGAAGVVASLLYLAGQVRSSSRIARQEAARSVLAKLNASLDAITRDESMADIWLRGSAGLARLTQAEQVRFSTMLLALFRTYEELLSYEGAGVDWDWDGFHGQIDDVIRAHGVGEWWEQRKGWFSARFQARMRASRQGDQPGWRHLVAEPD